MKMKMKEIIEKGKWRGSDLTKSRVKIRSGKAN